ncbi:MAG: SHOCT domain-containing protein [Clostridiaceae bacterium]
MHPFYGANSQFLGQSDYWWVGIVSMLSYLLFWAVVIIVAYRLVKKYIINTGVKISKEDTAMIILRERYARGEIASEEFHRIKEDLEK